MKKSAIQYLSVLLLLLLAACAKEDDQPTELSELSIAANSVTVNEGESASFTLSLTAPLSSPAVVNLQIEGTATNGGDYQSINSSISIPANQLTVSLTITTLEDDIEEDTEIVKLTLTDTDNDGISILQSQASISIVDVVQEFQLSPADTRSYMVNPSATEETVALFYNLKRLSETRFIVGQQDAFHLFFNDNRGESDMKKTTGRDPGLLGSDFMFITSDRNNETPNNWFYQQEQLIKEDVVQAYNQGMINAFTWHFNEPYDGEHFYTAEMTSFQKANAFKSIMPGASNHEYFKAKLDKVASVAKSLVGNDGKPTPIIFRPFHEFDGHWFWWGADYCSPQEFITIWRFMVEYLRDTKGVNNMLFAFSPDNSYTTESGYLSRYPGDDYVDILGMDNYGDFDNEGATGVEKANQKLQIVSDLAKERVKIATLAETGYFVTPGQNSPISNFYSENLYNALTDNDIQIGYMMFWNNTRDTYCIPPPGQPDTNDFIDFANKPRSVLQDGLMDMYTLPATD